MLGLSFSSKFDWGSYNISIAEITSKKNKAMICSIKFFSPEVALYLCKSTIQFAWNSFVMAGLLLLALTWICYRSYQNEYVVLFVLHLLPLWNPLLW